MRGFDPIDNRQLTREEIKRCEDDSAARLQLISSDVIESLPPRKKDTKYTPLSLRQDKPYAISWLIKRYPSELSSAQIAKLTGSTKNTVEAIKMEHIEKLYLNQKARWIVVCAHTLILKKH